MHWLGFRILSYINNIFNMPVPYCIIFNCFIYYYIHKITAEKEIKSKPRTAINVQVIIICIAGEHFTHSSYKFLFIRCLVSVKYSSKITFIIVICPCLAASLKITVISWCIKVVSYFANGICHTI